MSIKHQHEKAAQASSENSNQLAGRYGQWCKINIFYATVKIVSLIS